MAATSEQLIARILQARNAYQVLDLPLGTTDTSSIRKQYLNISRKIHPDRCNDARANAAFQRLSAAYNHLIDPNRHSFQPETGRSQPPPSYDERPYGYDPSQHERPFNFDPFASTSAYPPPYAENVSGNAEETLRQAYDTIIADIMNGNFDQLMWLLSLLKHTNPALAELDTEQIKSFLEKSRHQIHSIGTVTTPLHECMAQLNQQYMALRELPTLAVMSKSTLLLQMLHVLLQVPIRIHEASNRSFLSHRALSWFTLASAAVLGFTSVVNWAGSFIPFSAPF